MTFTTNSLSLAFCTKSENLYIAIMFFHFFCVGQDLFEDLR